MVKRKKKNQSNKLRKFIAAGAWAQHHQAFKLLVYQTMGTATIFLDSILVLGPFLYQEHNKTGRNFGPDIVHMGVGSREYGGK